MPFLKGHVGYNKGVKVKSELRVCLRCSKNFWVNQARILKGEGKYCSRDCSNKSTAKRGEKSPHYKEKVGYYAVHDWLYLNFGKAAKCENCGSDKKVQWAKLKGKEYDRKRENFWQLCCLCHLEYDGTSVVNQKPKW